MTEYKDHEEHDEAEHEDALAVEHSISQVGRNQSKKLPPVVIGIVGFALVAVVIAILFSGEEKKEIVKSTGEEYELRTSKVPQQIEKAIPTASAQVPQLVIPDMPELTQEQLEKMRQEIDLRNRRRHAPVVLINRLDNEGNAASDGKTQAHDNDPSAEYKNALAIDSARKMAYLERANKAALDAAQNSNGGGDKSDKSISASELNSAAVVTNFATNLENPSFKIAQGKVIPGILETAIQTDLSGMLRAIVSEDVYSENGEMLLIMKGSRLIGEYKSGVAQGQVRVFVIWTRLLRKDGVDIKLDSPGTDSIGRSGLEGWVDTHFVERFGAATAMSLISGFAQQGASNQSQQQSLSQSFNKSAEVILNKSVNIPPTIGVDQGSKINVFVAKDLDFKKAVLSAEHTNDRGME